MKPNQILILLCVFVLILFTCLGGCAGYHIGKSNCGELVKSDTVTIVKHDSILITQTIKSKPVTIRKNTVTTIAKIDTLPCDTVRIIARELVQLSDTLIYSDTIRNDISHHIVVNDTVIGKRLSLGIEFRNLRPHVNTIITNTKKVRQWTVYGLVQIPTNGRTVSVIPTVELTTPFGLCVGYGFEPIGMRHVPNIGYAIKINQK